ncbi:C10 family peptidase [Ichthyobacterium seriolicida]|uniref:Pyrogenic exotoxin B n=1 Tax=Ichthyobacterium seriolicida TaxID=242600 RepID=A0A1J1EBH9_9FLAO|nr:C10 family peptidase [Ichthyobacterium seriolicida]BAV94864.1 pyrogenic exotoxin B [Ichthyobacterium seriolicida]
MWNYKNNLIFYFVLFIFFSCNKDHLDTPDLSNKNIQDINKVSDALKYLNNTTFLQYSSENSNTATYSRNSNVLSNTLRMSDIDTIYDFRLTEHEPLLKLVCLKKNGYFLTSYLDLNINKVPPVLFYSENKFNPNNVNPGLINYINSFAEGKIAQDKYLKSNPYKQKKMLDIHSAKDPVNRGRVNPLLKTYWSQNKFLDFYVMINNREMTVGCVPIAIGQVIFYYYHNNPNAPKTIYTKRNHLAHYPNFSAMKLGRGTEATRKFLHMIGYYIGANYGFNETGGHPEKSVELFGDMEIDVESYDYNSNNYARHTDNIITSLDRRRPVIVYAYGTRKIKRSSWQNPASWFTRYTYGDGHAWVCDGYSHNNGGELFFHMNWGWGYRSRSWTHFTDWKIGNARFNYLRKTLITKPRFPF